MPEFGIAAKLTPPKIDPLAVLGQTQSIQTSALQNKLLGQQINGKMALGRAVTGATDPATGKTDWQKAIGSLAQDPEGSFQVPEAAAAAQARQLADMQLSREQIDTSLKKLAPVADLSLSLISGAKTTPLTRENIIGAIKTNLVDTGVLDPNGNPDDQRTVMGFVNQLTDDPVKNQLALQRLYSQLHPTLEGLTTLKGNITQTDTGPSTVISRTSPATGVVESLGAIDKGLTPEAAVSPNFTRIGPNGVPEVVTKGATAAAQATGAPPVGIPTGQPAGSVEAQAAQQQASAGQFTADVNDAGGFAQRMQGINNAAKALAAAQTGKAGQAIQDWRAVLNTLGVPLSEKDKTKAVAFDEAKKYLTDYANRRGAALGMGTDAGREMIHAANPSVDINKAAAQDILKVITGLERMQNAQVAAATTAGVKPGDYATWRAGWNRNINPAGFMADQIPASRRAKDFDAMSKPEQAKYARAVKAAIDAGYFTADDLRK